MWGLHAHITFNGKFVQADNFIRLHYPIYKFSFYRESNLFAGGTVSKMALMKPLVVMVTQTLLLTGPFALGGSGTALPTACYSDCCLTARTRHLSDYKMDHELRCK